MIKDFQRMLPQTMKEYRKRHGFSQEDLAAYMGISSARTISNYETGKVEIPGPVAMVIRMSPYFDYELWSAFNYPFDCGGEDLPENDPNWDAHMYMQDAYEKVVCEARKMAEEEAKKEMEREARRLKRKERKEKGSK